MDRNFEELDGRALLARTRIHRVQRLVSAAHRILALEERDSDAFSRLSSPCRRPELDDNIGELNKSGIVRRADDG